MLDYKRILITLKPRLDELTSLGDPKARELEYVIEQLEEWVNTGRVEEFPLDLTEWGIELDDQEDEVVDERIPTDLVGEVMSDLTSVKPSGGNGNHSDVNEMGKNRVDLNSELTIKVEHKQDGGDGHKNSNEILYSLNEGIEDISPDKIRFLDGVTSIQKLIDQGSGEQLLNALSLCEQLNQVENLDADEKAKVKSLKTQAQFQLQQMITDALNMGDHAMNDGDINAARTAYKKALDFSQGKNERAEAALLELSKKEESRISDDQLIALKLKLANNDGGPELEEGVREGESLIAEGRLPDDLVELVRKARERFDEIRTRSHQITTNMHFGNLEQSYQSISELEALIFKGQMVTYDAVIEDYRKTHEVLDEARTIWRDRSLEAVQYAFSNIDRYLKEHKPRIAKNILDRARLDAGDPPQPRPFHEDAIRKLDEKTDEIDRIIEKLDQAEALVSRSEKEVDSINSLKYLLEAQELWPSIDLLEIKLQNTRQTAISSMCTKIEDCIRDAKSAITYHKFDNARKEVSRANTLAARWPQPEKPNEIKALLNVCQDLKDQIQKEEKTFNEFNESVKKIREYKKQKEQHRLAFNLLDKMKREKRYKSYPELNILISEMDPLRGLNEQLNEAKIAEQEQDWERVKNISKNLIDLADGEIAADAMKLLAKADTEIKLIMIRDLVNQNDFITADTIITPLLSDRPEISSRIAEEIAVIEQVKNDSVAINELFGEASRDARKEGVKERCDALKIFRYIGGDRSFKAQEWPEYKLSTRTVEARNRAYELSEELRMELLPDLETFYSERNKQKLDADQLKLLADKVSVLREANLLESEEERAMVRWVEILQAKNEAEVYIKNDNWADAERLWEGLQTQYPRNPVVFENLKTAQIKYALQNAMKLVEQEKVKEALEFLWNKQRQEGLLQSDEIRLAIADIYKGQEHFEQALDIIQNTKWGDHTLDEATKIKSTILGEVRIRKILNEVAGCREENNVIKALTLLIECRNDVQVGESNRLNNLFEEIKNQQINQYLEIINTELEKLTTDSKIQSMITLVDLKNLEDIIGLDEEARNSNEVIDKIDLHETIPNVAENLVKQATQFSMMKMWANDALRESESIRDRMRGLDEVVRTYNIERDDLHKNYKAAQERIANVASKLQFLIDSLTPTFTDGIWNSAIISGDFDELDRINNKITNLELSEIEDVIRFKLKINELKYLINYCYKGIRDIRKFYIEEEFGEVVEKIKKLYVMPEYMESGIQFTQIDEEDYHNLYELISPRLRIFGFEQKEDLVGWGQVKDDALEHENNYRLWKKWGEECASIVTKSNVARELASHFNNILPWDHETHSLFNEANNKGATSSVINIICPQLFSFESSKKSINIENEKSETYKVDIYSGRPLPYIYQKWAWENAVHILNKVLLMITSGPDELGLDQPTMSEKAKNAKNVGESGKDMIIDNISEVKKEINDIEQTINSHGGFPQQKDFDFRFKNKDFTGIRKLIDVAILIGPESIGQAKLIKGYQAILRQHTQKEQQSFIKKIFGVK